MSHEKHGLEGSGKRGTRKSGIIVGRSEHLPGSPEAQLSYVELGLCKEGALILPGAANTGGGKASRCNTMNITQHQTQMSVTNTAIAATVLHLLSLRNIIENQKTPSRDWLAAWGKGWPQVS